MFVVVLVYLLMYVRISIRCAMGGGWWLWTPLLTSRKVQLELLNTEVRLQTLVESLCSYNKVTGNPRGCASLVVAFGRSFDLGDYPNSALIHSLEWWFGGVPGWVFFIYPQPEAQILKQLNPSRGGLNSA